MRPGGAIYVANVFVTLCLLLPGASAAREHWAGLRGGGVRHNADTVSVEPDGLKGLWRRSFRPVRFGDWMGEPNHMDLPGGRGSYNLAVLDGKVALLALDHPDPSAVPESYYATVLDGTTGETVNCVRVMANKGNNRVYRWPYNGVSGSSDTPHGLAVIGWDPETRILFTGQCGYDSAYTAYLPLANADGYRPGQAPEEGVPAYEKTATEHPDYQDTFGRTRAGYRTIMGVGNEWDDLKPWAWGLTTFYGDPANPESKKYDADLAKVHGRQGASFYNTSAFFRLATGDALIGVTKGADWGHNTAGDAYLFHKHTGLKAVTEWPEEPTDQWGKRLRPFTSRGVAFGNGRVFLAGPGQDMNENHTIGTERPEGLLPRVDQGLALWAYDYAMHDLKPDDGAAGPAARETARLEPAFAYRMDSGYKPTDDIASWGQSFYETDGFYRPKAMLIDGQSLWFAWKPSQAESVELIHAADGGMERFSLDVGRGGKGVDLWPKLSLVRSVGRPLLAYYTGYAQHRKRYMPEDAEAVLSRYSYKHRPWEELDERTRNTFLRQARTCGVWTDDLLPPRCPAEVSVFDAESGDVKWTYNLSANHPTLPANGFWSYIDRSHMVCAGPWCYVGWVDTAGEKAVLRLVALDVTADAPAPVERTVPLGFPSKGNERSTLMDLAAVDGRLYAYVLQSESFWIRDPRWKAQHVLAVGAD